jgi:hypothetical protein
MATSRIIGISTEITLPGELSADVLELDSAVVGSRRISLSNLLTVIGGETVVGAQQKADATRDVAIQRGNHTGTQLASTISDLESAVAATPSVTANSAKVTNATHTGDVTGSQELAIANNAVTNEKAGDMPPGTIKGRLNTGTGDPQDLTPAEARSVMNVLTSAEVTTAAQNVQASLFDIISPQDKDLLRFNSVANKWKNVPQDDVTDGGNF